MGRDAILNQVDRKGLGVTVMTGARSSGGKGSKSPRYVRKSIQIPGGGSCWHIQGTCERLGEVKLGHRIMMVCELLPLLQPALHSATQILPWIECSKKDASSYEPLEDSKPGSRLL